MRATDVLRSALMGIVEEMGLNWPAKAVIEPPRDPKHGDLAANIAMLLAREAHKNPRELAQIFVEKLPQRCADIEKVEVAGPGFCNVTFSQHFWRKTVCEVEAAGAAYGQSSVGQGRKTLVEYVSANPTGPLHVGHGRGAAVGDSLARLLRKAGFDVEAEYYINDAGRQMRILGLSVWLRVKELAGRPVEWPEDYYRGSYIIDIAREMLAEDPSLPDMEDQAGQDRCYERAMNEILDGIKADLADFRVEHQHWFSEKTLVESGAVKAAFDALTEAGHTFDKDGAFWFATQALGDDKDRVLRKSDGSLTYFASDIAYHHNKFQRGYDWLIDIWGADHHGYVPRMRAAITAMGKPRESFDVVLIQLVNLLQGGKPVSMSTRAGTFETLADVVKEVGADAARFMFLSRKSDTSLDFDLELAKQRSLDNPVYYVQYAHARICSVFANAKEKGYEVPSADELIKADLSSLVSEQAMDLMAKIAEYPSLLTLAAKDHAPHMLCYYLKELAAAFHTFYNAERVVIENDVERNARLALLAATRQVLGNGLALLGISAPEYMARREDA